MISHQNPELLYLEKSVLIVLIVHIGSSQLLQKHELPPPWWEWEMAAAIMQKAESYLYLPVFSSSSAANLSARLPTSRILISASSVAVSVKGWIPRASYSWLFWDLPHTLLPAHFSLSNSDSYQKKIVSPSSKKVDSKWFCQLNCCFNGMMEF